MDPEDCFSCRQNADRTPAPREVITVRDGWRVAHAIGPALLGWLVALPRRHVLSLAELSDVETAALGPLLRDVTRALQAVLDCRKTYVALFAESPGFAHLHFHVLPRMVDWADDQLGPAAILQFGSAAGHPVPESDMDALALRLRPHIG
jgi:diadenosine tetraphosphate (Ap4A) HIT family hydrolase